VAKLYTNNRGIDVVSHSFSAGQEFRDCPKKYYFNRIVGWKRKERSAATKFGKAFEDSIQFFHTNGCKPDTGVEEFKRLWLTQKEDEGLNYTRAEGSWSNLYKCGSQLLKLYEVLLPSLPIKDPLFQMNLEKTPFPGTDYADLRDQGFIDMITRSPWVHPLLPKVDIPKGSPYRTVIWDIKTAGKMLDATPDLLQLDPQLLRYGWLSGHRDVGFLWAVKCIVDSIDRGDEVTVLEPFGKWKLADKVQVFKVVKDLSALLVGTDYQIVRAESILERIKGRGSTERKEKALYRFLRSGRLSPIPVSCVTKAKIQAVVVRLPEEHVKEAGEVVAYDIIQIVDHNNRNFWPRTPGVRFPNQKCSFCSHRGLCLDNQSLVDDLLVKIENPKPKDDWMDELGEDE
jgi:hypothetical protein